MRIVELILDETQEINGVEAISLVAAPAIESNFVALKDESHEIKFKIADNDRRLIIGAALIPNKMIFRKANKQIPQDFYCYFSHDTVRKTGELFMQRGFQNQATLEHEMQLKGVTVVESWFIEGEQDKSRMFGLSDPIGTWMVVQKVTNEDLWQNEVKTGNVKGFSIEGAFAERVEMAKHEPTEAEQTLAALRELLKIEQL
jgi:hypothetical protein